VTPPLYNLVTPEPIPTRSETGSRTKGNSVKNTLILYREDCDRSEPAANLLLPNGTPSKISHQKANTAPSVPSGVPTWFITATLLV